MTPDWTKNPTLSSFSLRLETTPATITLRNTNPIRAAWFETRETVALSKVERRYVLDPNERHVIANPAEGLELVLGYGVVLESTERR